MVIIAKSPLSAIQFNVLAIITLLAFMPFAIAIITNAGSSTDGNFQESISMDNSNSQFRGQWINNGQNFTDYYETNIPMPSGWYGCAYIQNGDCMGFNGNYDPIVPIQSAKFDWYLPTPSIVSTQTHGSVLAPGEYYGSSGTGPFEWLIYGETFDGIEDNETLDKIRYSFVDIFTTYICDYSGFTDLNIEASLSFIHENKTKTFEDFEMKVSNKYQFERYNNQNSEWENACVNGMVLDFDLTGFESLALTEWNGGEWSSTDHLIKINSIERADKQNLGSTPLPFAGDSIFAFTAQHQSVNTVQAGFIIQSLTTLMSIGTFALAIASTPYWDPFKSFFKGAV